MVGFFLVWTSQQCSCYHLAGIQGGVQGIPHPRRIDGAETGVQGLKQGSISVVEYRDKFAQLSRYAPNEVADDANKRRLAPAHV